MTAFEHMREMIWSVVPEKYGWNVMETRVEFGNLIFKVSKPPDEFREVHISPGELKEVNYDTAKLIEGKFGPFSKVLKLPALGAKAPETPKCQTCGK